MSLLQSLDSFVRKECLEMGGELHQLLQRFVTNHESADAPVATPEPVAVGVTPVEQESEAQ